MKSRKGKEKMSKEKKHNLDSFWNLSNCVADSIETMTDEEYRAEFSSTVTEDAKKAVDVFGRTLKAFKQRHLTAARQLHAKKLADLKTHVVSIPATTEKRRALLQSLLKIKPEMQSGFVTAQYRNLEELPDEDVQSALEQLAELGVWDGKLPDEPGDE